MKWGTSWKIRREMYRLMSDHEWRPWFAWYPVCLQDSTWAWLEYVEFNQPMTFNLPRYRAR